MIELVMVIGLVSILAMVALPYFIDMRDDAKNAVTKDRMQALKRAIMGDGRVVSGGVYAFAGFYADRGSLPTTLADLVTQGAQPAYNPITRIGWRGPYIDNSSLSVYNQDGWGTNFEYSSASRYIRSYGPNKVNNAGAGDDITLTF